jgi:hypothetical protein
MRYFAYENWRAHGHVTKVHTADCPFCKGGLGLSGGTRPDNGRLIDLGDLLGVEEAVAAAKKSARESAVKKCGVCIR